MKKMSLLLVSTLLFALPMAQAVNHVPGTGTYYSYNTDPITDVNTSFVRLYEVNDQYGDTALGIRCANFGEPGLWIYLSSKHDLLSQDDADAGLMPAVTVRMGTDAPVVLSNRDLSSIVSESGQHQNDAVGINAAAAQRIVNGLNTGKRAVLRVNRPTGGQALTYTFSAEGFAEAWNAVRGCSGGNAPRPTPARTGNSSAGNSGANAPKFLKWYFTTCRDASSGNVRTGLIAGRAHLCDLVIETVPNGAQPISADFRYELEYREGNQTGKLMLDGVDYWPASGGPEVRYRQNGNNLIFTLPLNVRARPDRVYTSINVTGNIRFSNGSSKKVYEPLPVKLY